ncbi:MAG TPA: VOC family protein [Micromonosporaceae bacterium]|jgi:predicted enzyme related to lactoylglutathione lyase|nr:VOC family protein [Micromonosporaceae bacterium]
MALTVGMVTIDCAYPRKLVDFWTQALGYEVLFGSDEYIVLQAGSGGGGPRLGLQRVPEPRVGKNAVHLDLSTDDRAAEVSRLTKLGATIVDEKHAVPGYAWTVLADPEGTVFCVGAPE